MTFVYVFRIFRSHVATFEEPEKKLNRNQGFIYIFLKLN